MVSLGSFFDDLRKNALDIYRDKYFPVTFLIAGVLLGAMLSQWILILIGAGGFFYFQFFKRER